MVGKDIFYNYDVGKINRVFHKLNKKTALE